MSNYVHCILSSATGGLSDTLYDFNRLTARKILEVAQGEGESRREWMLFQFKYAAKQYVRNEHYQVCPHQNHAVEISAFVKSMGESKMDYIYNNPVWDGLEKAEEYVYSSARDYMTGREGLVRLEMW